MGTQEAIPIDNGDTNMQINASVRLPQDIEGKTSRPSTYDPEIGVDLAPLQFQNPNSTVPERRNAINSFEGEQSAFNDNDKYQAMMDTLDAPINLEHDLIMEKDDLVEIMNDKLPLRFRVTLSRLEKRQNTAQRKFKKKRKLVATPPARRLVR